ncbi:SGNH/GDSL hydrolase family protein, partial [Clostridium botulinum]|nr:SGNH/GDSL hydrolase family protein [Clostridium botulinum]NFO54372.1 SGNH/GDSL hydrolase family protein [Clostridium botulinum]
VYYPLANPITEKLNIKDTLQTFQDGYIMLDNAITPTAQLEYSTNIPSAIGGLTKVVDHNVDEITNIESTISDMDAEIGEARKDKNTLEERLEEDRTNILKKFNELDNQDIFKITKDIKNKNIKILGDSIGAGVGGTGYSATGEIIVGNNKSNETGHCWANSFRDYLQSKYNCIVKNWSVSGWKSSDIVTNISTLITETDDIVICAIGANNCYIENGITLLESDIKTINEYCENHNKKVIFIGTIQTLTSSHENKGIKMEDIDNLLREVTTNLNVCFIPMYKLFNDYLLYSGADSSLFYYNEEHPNDNGYDAMFYLMANYMGFYTDLELRNKLYSLYDTGWLPLPLINGTVANTIDIPLYRRAGRMLSLKGEIDNIISTVTTVATLPSGFTPNSKVGGNSIALSFLWTGADTQSRMFINKNGNIIVPNHTDTKKMWLDGINFMID